MKQGPYRVTKIDERTFAVEEKTPASQGLLYLLEGSKSALLIDTGLGMGDLSGLVTKLTEKPVSVVNTHTHFDHIGGNHFFPDIWYHEDERAVFALHTDKAYLQNKLRVMVPGIFRLLFSPLLNKVTTLNTAGNYHTMKDGHVFDLGDRTIEVIHTPGHSPGSVCLLDRKAALLFSGDTVCDLGIMLNLELSLGPDVFLASMKKIEALQNTFTVMYPGHHAYPIGREFIGRYIHCAEGILNGSDAVEGFRIRELSSGGEKFLSAEYDGIRIALPVKQARIIP
ncbi:MBL fold metallo-hydrolase [Spirochaetia bacterium]|nr:MBL fold metallo-hydrolase [Spirochaetia bacterium]